MVSHNSDIGAASANYARCLNSACFMLIVELFLGWSDGLCGRIKFDLGMHNIFHFLQQMRVEERRAMVGRSYVGFII